MPFKDPDRRRAYHRAYQRVYRIKKPPVYVPKPGASSRQNRRLRALIMALLGPVCTQCGFADLRALHIDHVNGDGAVDRARYKSQGPYYKAILVAEGVGFQILCASCNWIKRHANAEYNHLPATQAPCETIRETRKLRIRILALLGARCAHCGFDDVHALQVDHIEGAGVADRARFTGSAPYYRAILRAEGAGYQLLCANCNWIKRHENQEQNQHRD